MAYQETSDHGALRNINKLCWVLIHKKDLSICHFEFKLILYTSLSMSSSSVFEMFNSIGQALVHFSVACFNSINRTSYMYQYW